jgi:rhodanese-related sulfurtransferase
MKTLQPAELDSTEGRLVDVRNLDEFASVRLPRAECVPLDRLVTEASQWDRSEALILMCKSGMRSGKGAEQLESLGFSNIATLAGGIDACSKAGLPVVQDRKTIPVFRQVLIMSGLILLTSLLLSYWSPLWLALTAIVSGGLVFAGTTGICPMARFLEWMPWNRVDSCEDGCCSKG